MNAEQRDAMECGHFARDLAREYFATGNRDAWRDHAEVYDHWKDFPGFMDGYEGRMIRSSPIRRVMILLLLAIVVIIGANIAAHALIMFAGPCEGFCVPNQSDALTANRIVWELIGGLSK